MALAATSARAILSPGSGKLTGSGTCSAAAPVSVARLGQLRTQRECKQWGVYPRRHGFRMTRHVAMQDSVSGLDGEDPSSAQAPEAEYPPGVVRFETMVVLRPDVTDEERLAFTQRYEEFLVAGGAVFVEMFNRGMQPLAYNITMKNMGGVRSRYLDGIYLLFMYVTEPESQKSLQAKLNKDDDVIRSTTFRLKL